MKNGDFVLTETPRALPSAVTKLPKDSSFNNFSVYKASKELNGVPIALANGRAKEIRARKEDPLIQEEYQNWLRIQEGKLALSENISVDERIQIHKIIKKLVETMKSCVEYLGNLGVDVIAGLNYDNKMFDLCVNSGRILHKGHVKNGFTLSNLLNDQRRNLMFNSFVRRNSVSLPVRSIKNLKERRNVIINLLSEKFKKDLPQNSSRWDLHPINRILNSFGKLRAPVNYLKQE